MRATRTDARKRWRIISTFQRQILSKSTDVADALAQRSVGKFPVLEFSISRDLVAAV